MAKPADLKDLFTDLLKDVYYAEKKILKTLPQMAKAVGADSELGEAYLNHAEETEGQIARIEEVFKLIDQTPKAKKCDAIEGIIAEGDELISDIKSKPVLQAGLLACSQAVEHYEIARYGTLVEWARLLGHEEAADLLEETLDQEKKTDELLSDLARDGVNEAALDEMESDEGHQTGSSHGAHAV